MCVYCSADHSSISFCQYPQCQGYHKLWDWTNYNQLNISLCVDLHIVCTRGIRRHSYPEAADT